MPLYDELVADLKRDEAFVPHAYQDSEGFWTIGYGTLIDKRVAGAGIPEDIARELLTIKLDERVAELHRARPFVEGLGPNVRRALYNMAYNLGVPRLLGFKRMWAALEKRDWSLAALEALDSKWAKQVGERSKRVAGLIRKGNM